MHAGASVYSEEKKTQQKTLVNNDSFIKLQAASGIFHKVTGYSKYIS